MTSPLGGLLLHCMSAKSASLPLERALKKIVLLRNLPDLGVQRLQVFLVDLVSVTRYIDCVLKKMALALSDLEGVQIELLA